MCFILKQVKLLFSNQCILRVASNRFLCWGTSPLCNEQSSLLLTPSLTCCFHHPLKSLFIPLYFHLWDQRPFRFMHAVAGQKCLFQNEKVGKAVNYEYHPPPQLFRRWASIGMCRNVYSYQRFSTSFSVSTELKTVVQMVQRLK